MRFEEALVAMRKGFRVGYGNSGPVYGMPKNHIQAYHYGSRKVIDENPRFSARKIESDKWRLAGD